MSDHISGVVVDTSASPNARLRPVPLTAVKVSDSFWAPRLRINLDVTVPSQHRRLEETGRLDNFRRAAGKLDGPFVGIYFKWSVSSKAPSLKDSLLAKTPLACICGDRWDFCGQDKSQQPAV